MKNANYNNICHASSKFNVFFTTYAHNTMTKYRILIEKIKSTRKLQLTMVHQPKYVLLQHPVNITDLSTVFIHIKLDIHLSLKYATSTSLNIYYPLTTNILWKYIYLFSKK